MQSIADIKAAVGSDWAEFEGLLASSLNSESALLNQINTYLLDASGKKLRPLLALLTARACSGFVNHKAVICATVSELIHTATLLHDDVVDNSDSRRGRPTIHKLFSPGTSVLMGDYWLTRAIHLMLESNIAYSVLSLFSKALEELAEGEMLQMEYADKLTTGWNEYIEIIRRKTASLFKAAIKGAAIVSVDADSSETERILKAMEEYAFYLGCSFQMRDDILDYYPSEVIGKDSGCDIEERKITLPLLCAMENAPDQAAYIRERMSQIVVNPQDMSVNAPVVEEIRAYVVDHGGLDSAMTKLYDYIDKAVECLDSLEDSDSKKALVALTNALRKLK